MLSILPNIPENSVESQMEKSISVPFDRNIRDHLWKWSTLTNRTGHTEICRSILTELVHYPYSLHLHREFGKGIKS